jgi:hypothetical protein
VKWRIRSLVSDSLRSIRKRESEGIWENENSIVYLRSKVEKEIQKQQHEKP